MKRRFLLDVVVGEGTAVLQLLTSEDQTLLVRRDTLLVCGIVRWGNFEIDCSVVLRTLDLGLDIVNGVRRLHLEGDGLAREGLDEDLHLEGLDSEG